MWTEKWKKSVWSQNQIVSIRSSPNMSCRCGYQIVIVFVAITFKIKNTVAWNGKKMCPLSNLNSVYSFFTKSEMLGFGLLPMISDPPPHRIKKFNFTFKFIQHHGCGHVVRILDVNCVRFDKKIVWIFYPTFI